MKMTNYIVLTDRLPFHYRICFVDTPQGLAEDVFNSYGIRFKEHSSFTKEGEPSQIRIWDIRKRDIPYLHLLMDELISKADSEEYLLACQKFIDMLNPTK